MKTTRAMLGGHEHSKVSERMSFCFLLPRFLAFVASQPIKELPTDVIDQLLLRNLSCCFATYIFVLHMQLLPFFTAGY